MLFDGAKKVENAIYIYIILVFCSACFFLVFFAIRERFARRHRAPKHVQTVIGPAEVPATTPALPIPIQKLYKTEEYGSRDTLVKHPRVSSDAASMQDFEIASTMPDWDSVTLQRSPELERPVRYQAQVQISKRTKHVYEEEELRRLEPVVGSLTKVAYVKLSQLLSPRVIFMKTPIPTEYVMASELHDIKTWLNDPSLPTKSLALVRLVYVCAFQEPFDNIHHFHQDLCDLVVALVDSLNIYSYSYNFPFLQVMLVDLAALVAWEHWNWSWGCKFASGKHDSRMSLLEAIDSGYQMENEKSGIKNSGRIDNGNLEGFDGYGCSAVLSDVTVFRLLCNLYLGSPALAKDIRADGLFKLGSIFSACAKNTRCHQQKDMVNLISQAVASTSRESIKAFFYTVLSDILRPHLFCCLEPDDIFAADSEIQQLVFRGLWTDQPPLVREKTADIVALLGERFPDATAWTKSMKYVSTRHDSPGRSGAPGSWSNFA